MTLSRRTLLQIAGAASLWPLLAPGRAGAMAPKLGAPTAFDINYVTSLARDLAAKPYQQVTLVPEAWRALNYDQYRAIRFRTDSALWQDSVGQFRAQFFAPGFYFDRAVQINIVADGQAQPLMFHEGLFDFGKGVPQLPIDPNLGFSGFRLHAPINRDDYRDEFVVFQGASYFRGVGKDQRYGLSARGLAIDTAEPSGEEFPDFRAFWLEQIDPEGESIRVHALMDSPRLAGAYRFDITPGKATRMQVHATLFPRETLSHVGIAPLTSMFLYDGTDRTRFDDFRPAVHDSDGLLIDNGAGERLWRPLANPRDLQISSFVDNNPRGFGLLQRRHGFEAFADLEARYELRPSIWVEPYGNWGKGAVVLVEIPTEEEINDNIVSYWRPLAPLAAGEEYAINYTLSWCWEPPVSNHVAAVTNTRMGAHPKGGRLVVIDFAKHPRLPEDVDTIRVDFGSNRGDVKRAIVQRNELTGGIRIAFRFQNEDKTSVGLRAMLRDADNQALSEVWLYRWTA